MSSASLIATSTRTVLISLVALGVSLHGTIAALAHPHVWIKVRTQLITEGGALTGLRHTWVLDESWLASQLEEHDKDKDGRLTPAELAPLAVESRQTLETFKSFTVVRSGGSLVRAVKPQEVRIDYHGALLGMTFVVSLAKPLALKGDMLLEVYDAGYFSSFTFDGPDAVTFSGVAPQGCTVKSGVSASPQQMRDYRQMLKEIGTELSKPFTPQSVAISCAVTQTTPASRSPTSATAANSPVATTATTNAEVGSPTGNSAGNSRSTNAQGGTSGIAGSAVRATEGMADASGPVAGGQVSGAPKPLPGARPNRPNGSR